MGCRSHAGQRFHGATNAGKRTECFPDGAQKAGEREESDLKNNPEHKSDLSNTASSRPPTPINPSPASRCCFAASFSVKISRFCSALNESLVCTPATFLIFGRSGFQQPAHTGDTEDYSFHAGLWAPAAMRKLTLTSSAHLNTTAGNSPLPPHGSAIPAKNNRPVHENSLRNDFHRPLKVRNHWLRRPNQRDVSAFAAGHLTCTPRPQLTPVRELLELANRARGRRGEATGAWMGTAAMRPLCGPFYF